MENFEIEMNNNLKKNKKEIMNFLETVFSIYKGKLKIKKESLDISSSHCRVNLDKSPVTIKISFEPEFAGTIDLNAQNHYFSTEIHTKEKAESNFFNVVNLAIVMMKTSGNKFFIGSFEAYGTSAKQDVPIQLLFFENKKYLPYLKEHIKFAFKLNIHEKELDQLVEKYATIKKKYRDYRLICFYNFTEKRMLKSPYEGFYQKIKELKNRMRKI